MAQLRGPEAAEPDFWVLENVQTIHQAPQQRLLRRLFAWKEQHLPSRFRVFDFVIKLLRAAIDTHGQ